MIDMPQSQTRKSQTRTLAKKSGRWIPYVVFGVTLAWVGGVAFEISRETPAGASTPSELKTQVGEYVREGNSDDLNDLFTEDSVGDSYAKNYLAHLEDAKSSRLEVSINDHQGVYALTLSGVTKEGGKVCTSWQVKQKGGRWFLDAAPLVRPNPCATTP
ncbi:hypothetical protein ACFWOJ_35295 [Streptomyces sp. NPDC058439]|uniref:hypothetical protein n=1 Tax=Streptomyces sp. NPDC058439 TaxID=3346500 RepID=UPI0036556C34